MQLGFVGLGKMGGNMVHRIHRDSDHQVVAFDFSADAVSAAEGHGATGASSLEELVSKLDPPRTVWVMVPAGDPTEETVFKLADLMDEGDTVVDGGNTNWHDDVRRAAALDERGIHYIDVGTSGGVWGLEVGYCMMVGGHEESVQRLAPILDVLAPPDGWRRFGDSRSSRPTSWRSPASGTAARSSARGSASWPSAPSSRRATTSRASRAT
jgi:6-phosphogluconate dehydrogenase